MEVKTLGLALSLALMAIPVAIFTLNKVRLVKPLSVAVVRMVVQLSMIGLVLGFIFRVDHPALTCGWLAVMIIAGTYTVIERLKLPWMFLLPVVVVPLATATLSMLAILSLLVVRPDASVNIPFINPRFVIPVFGMLLGNSMNSIALAIDRFGGELRSNWSRYYADIAMGARANEASKPFLQAAIRASQTPRIMGMASTGIIALPGMMTGLIIQGADPTSAIKYQMLLLAAIFVAESAAVWGALRLYIGRLFNRDYLPASFIRAQSGE